MILLIAACLVAQPPPPSACTDCHGSAERGDPAPPRDIRYDTGTDAVGMGAHQAHLQSAISDPVACAECHHVPATIEDPLHIDADGLPAEVVFDDAVVGAGGTYHTAEHTCTVYCHDPFGDATKPNPSFTGSVGCGDCHGTPPPPPHPNVTDGVCTGCHPHQGSGPLHLNGKDETP